MDLVWVGITKPPDVHTDGSVDRRSLGGLCGGDWERSSASGRLGFDLLVVYKL